jgi:hypothetical protein
MEQVLVESEINHDQLKQIVATMPEEKWVGEMLYPLNNRRIVEYYIKLMMTHERMDNCDNVREAIG